MTYCTWEKIGEPDVRGWFRVRCEHGFILNAQPYPPASIRDRCRLAPPLDPNAPLGPGTHLKRILTWANIHGTADCGCNQMAAEMDANGAEWCAENIEHIVDHMQEAARKRGLPFLRAGARWLVRLAIARASAEPEPPIDADTPTAVVTKFLLEGKTVTADSQNVIEARRIAELDSQKS